MKMIFQFSYKNNFHVHVQYHWRFKSRDLSATTENTSLEAQLHTFMCNMDAKMSRLQMPVTRDINILFLTPCLPAQMSVFLGYCSDYIFQDFFFSSPVDSYVLSSSFCVLINCNSIVNHRLSIYAKPHSPRKKMQ